jgi:DNA-binding MarR family transcriptional regulator
VAEQAKHSKDLGIRRLQAESVLTLSRLLRRTEQRVSELLVAEGLHDITHAQANAMMVIFQAKTPHTASQVAAALGVSEVTVARFVKSLESGAWVQRVRSPSDGRAWLLRPTDKAFAALPNFIRVSNAMLDETYAGFSVTEIRQLLSIIDRVRANLRC